jgi:hypothetical protein
LSIPATDRTMVNDRMAVNRIIQMFSRKRVMD